MSYKIQWKALNPFMFSAEFSEVLQRIRNLTVRVISFSLITLKLGVWFKLWVLWKTQEPLCTAVHPTSLKKKLEHRITES